MTCGILGATISTFTRIGKANPEPLINVLSLIVKKSLVEMQLYSDVICEKCFKNFKLIARLQHKLSEACRNIIKDFSCAHKNFSKSSAAVDYDENQCLLVVDDSNLRADKFGIIAKAMSLASSKRREKSTRTKTEKKFQCNICEKSFRAYSHKVEHMVVHTQEKIFKCDTCGFTTTTKSNLTKHKQQHSKEYFCSICDKKLCNKFSLKEHMVVHSSSRPYQCKYCEKSFIRQRDRKIHQNSHMIDFEPFECEICHKHFVLKSRLTRHMAVHSLEKLFVCSVCNKKFARKDDLKSHERVHSGVKPYVCKECGKQFRYVSNCRNHLKCHNKEKKVYRCICCDMVFVTEAKYKGHLKTRSHKRKFSEAAQIEHVFCDTCKFSYTVDEYNLHQPVCEKKKIVEEISCEEFNCNICCISFENFNQLSEHTYHSHGSDETSVQIPVIQNTASVTQPLNAENKSNFAVSDGHYSTNVLNVLSGSENIASISASESVITSTAEPNVEQHNEPSTSDSNAVELDSTESLFKISDWDMNSYCQKMKG